MTTKPFIGVAAAALLLAACAEDDEQAWIVATFDVGGVLGQVSFLNPDTPDLTLEQCWEVLPDIETVLIAEAQLYMPLGQFDKIECIASAGDPIAPENQGG